MSVLMRDSVAAQSVRMPLDARPRRAQPQASLDTTLENWRRLVPEAALLTLSATLPVGVDVQRARQALLGWVSGWSRSASWFERSSLALDVSATGTAAEFCSALASGAAQAGLGLVLDLPAPSPLTDPGRNPCEGPDALRRLATQLRPQVTPTLTLATRWLRSRDDAQWAIEQDLPVRLVPGSDADPRQPLRDSGAGVRALVRQIAGKVPQVTVAWPDPGAALEVVRVLRKAGTACDLELPLGSPLGALRQVARAAGVPVRLHGHWRMPVSGELSSPHSGVPPQ